MELRVLHCVSVGAHDMTINYSSFKTSETMLHSELNNSCRTESSCSPSVQSCSAVFSNTLLCSVLLLFSFLLSPILFCSVLLCTVLLSCFVLFPSPPFCSVLFCSVLLNTIPLSSAYSALFCSTPFCCGALLFLVLLGSVLDSLLYCSVLI